MINIIEDLGWVFVMKPKHGSPLLWGSLFRVSSKQNLRIIREENSQESFTFSSSLVLRQVIPGISVGIRPFLWLVFLGIDSKPYLASDHTYLELTLARFGWFRSPSMSFRDSEFVTWDFNFGQELAFRAFQNWAESRARQSLRLEIVEKTHEGGF